jgi:phage terminase Nu1 subunit (DNA packaging protein)
MIVNRSDLADILGVSPKTIDRRVSEGMPVAGAAQAQDDRQWKFDTAAVIAWLRRQAPRPSQVKRSQVELRIHNADAGLKEFELQQKQKTLIHLDDVAEVLKNNTTLYVMLYKPSRRSWSMHSQQHPTSASVVNC